MQYIDSYNASYPLAFYDVGTAYSFYGQSSSRGTLASPELIQKYSHILKGLATEEQRSAIKPIGKSSDSPTSPSKINRFYAVVVDKVKMGDTACIVVMFCNKSNGRSEYFTRKYAVNSSCSTDGKELMPVSTHLSFESTSNGKVGGVTLAGKNNSVGGITRAQEQNSTTSSVGRITKVNRSDAHNSTETDSAGRVGGITLVRNNNPQSKTGGITRVKKK